MVAGSALGAPSAASPAACRPHCGGMEGRGHPPGLGGSSRPGYIPREGAVAGEGGGSAAQPSGEGEGGKGGGVSLLAGLGRKAERRSAAGPPCVCAAAVRSAVCLRVPGYTRPPPPPPKARSGRGRAAGARRGGAPRPALRDGARGKGEGRGKEGSGTAPKPWPRGGGGSQTGPRHGDVPPPLTPGAAPRG